MNLLKTGRGTRTLALVLLFFLGASALYGSTVLLFDPSGKLMQLPEGILERTPFQDYTIPAILLGLFNGIMSLVIAFLVIRNVRYRAWLVMFQGCTLLVWLAAEVFMGMFFAALTLPFLVIGFLLLMAGIRLRKFVEVGIQSER